MPNVRWKDKSDITTLATGDRIPVTDVSDTDADKYFTPLEMQTIVKAFVNAGDVTENSIAITPIGQQTIWVPASAMETRVTSAPAAISAIEVGTSLISLKTMDFATGADEYCGFTVQMPKSWDAGVVKAQFIWSNASGSGGVSWGISAVSLADSGAMGLSRVGDGVGTVVVVDDTMLTAGDVHITAESGDITVAGAGAEEWVYYEILRDVSDSNDTLGVDARLHGVKIHYTVNIGNDS